MTLVCEIQLVGAGGEPVDVARTIVSHGVAELPPNRVELGERTLETTLPVTGGARTVRIDEANRKMRVEAVSGRVSARTRDELAAAVAHMLRLDEDLSAFYAVACADPDLEWCADGAGRMLRAPTVFEDVVKTNRTLMRIFGANRSSPTHSRFCMCTSSGSSS